MLPLEQLKSFLLPLWTQDLDIDPEDVLKDDHFHELGGDSIAAIRMVTAARKAGLRLSVEDVFRYPRFDTLLNHVASASIDGIPSLKCYIEPFELLKEAEPILDHVRSSMKITASEIEDAYPATPLQEALMVLSLKNPGSYTRSFMYTVPDDVDLVRLKDSWAEVYKRTSILRTRMIYLNRTGSVQVVLKEEIRWEKSPLAWAADPMTYQTPLARFSLLAHEVTGASRIFHMELHHGVYDGWSLARILQQVYYTYTGAAIPMSLQFSHFVAYTQTEDIDVQTEFWKQYLDNCADPSFPLMLKERCSAPFRQIIEDDFEIPDQTNNMVTSSIMLQTALAILIASYENIDDVIFGVSLSGRNADMENVAAVLGPTVVTLPLRVRLGAEKTVGECLSGVLAALTDLISNERYGMHRIRGLSESCRTACAFQTLLIIQPEPEEAPWKQLMKPCKTRREESFYSNAMVLECFMSKRSVHFEVQFDTSIVPEPKMRSLMRQLKHIATQLWTAKPETGLANINAFPAEQLSQIVSFAGPKPSPVAKLIHEAFQANAQCFFNNTAIDAHDGTFSYAQLDHLSTTLARQVLSSSLPGSNILICIEKSRWMAVAMLAILKAGCVCVPLDPSSPTSRLLEIAKDVESDLILTSMTHSSTCADLVQQQLVVSNSLINEPMPEDFLDVPKRSSTSVAFIMFTSGSTGKPKGVVQTHQGFCSILDALANAMRYTETSRVLQFAAYTFDVSIGDTFAAFLKGACLCIPSDDERVNDLANYINRAKVDQACLTPTVARTLATSTLPTLTNVTLGGEILTADDYKIWAHKATLNNIYGVTECTIWSAFTPVYPGWADSPGKIAGRLATRFWIVNPNNVNQLRAIGAIGELIIEGPTVAEGYWKNSMKSMSAFMPPPEWLRSIDSDPGLRKVYRTGDIVRYLEGGVIQFLGRSDSQVKLRGQRIELAEIESHIKRCIDAEQDVLVDILALKRTETDVITTILAAFIAPSPSSKSLPGDQHDLNFATTISNRLKNTIPQHMVPNVYIPMESLPRTTSGKMDRVALKRYCQQWTFDDLAVFQAQKQAPSRPFSMSEALLRRVWSETLGVDPIQIHHDDDFVRLGGNSIDAMKVVASLHNHGITISVREMFLQPKLENMVSLMKRIESTTVEEFESPKPFSLLESTIGITDILDEVSDTLEVPKHMIVDIMPCTPLQEGLMALSEKNPSTYFTTFAFSLPWDIDIQRFKKSWETVYLQIQCLRLRILFLKDVGMVQVVVKENIPWNELKSQSKGASAYLGKRLCHMSLEKSQNQQTSAWRFSMSLHHSIYDGWSLPLILKRVQAVYDDTVLSPAPKFSTFLRWMRESEAASRDYWGKHLRDVESVSEFPPRSWATSWSRGVSKVNDYVPHPAKRVLSAATGATATSCIKAAWSVLLSRYTESSEVVFGVTSTGRMGPLRDIEQLAAPTIATTPFLVSLTQVMSVSDLLQQVQRQTATSMEFEHFGLNAIKNLSKSAEMACSFQTLLIIQPEGESQEKQFSTPIMTLSKETLAQETNLGYALILECKLTTNGMETDLQFDKRCASRFQAQHLLRQFTFILRQMLEGSPSLSIRDIDICSAFDREQIMRWNSYEPETSNIRVDQAFQNVCTQYLDSQAIASWDGNFTYTELDLLSSRLSFYLAELEIQPNQCVPLYFEKSRWFVVAMMAVCRAGAAFVPLDGSLPSGRVREIVTRIGAKLILTSTELYASVQGMTEKALCVSERTISGLPSANSFSAISHLPAANILFIIFTSGSTGKPKGVMISHDSYMSGALARRSAIRRDSGTRMLQFSSFSFDTSVEEIIHTLLVGGVVCMPSENERLDPVALSQAIAKMQVNTVDLTPSFLTKLTPSMLPSVRVLILGGESMTSTIIQKWSGSVELINAYGPSECSIASHIAAPVHKDDNPANIGFGMGCRSWVVDPEDPHHLSPIGAIGELIIEGPIVGLGYLNDSQTTEKAFLQGLAWASKPSNCFYTTGDLVQYASDGSLIFVGRKSGDAQSKIRGQRIELEDVEFHMSQAIPDIAEITAEVIKPRSSDGKPGGDVYLAAFVSFPNGFDLSVQHREFSEEAKTRVEKVARIIQRKLRNKLPLYMVPTLFVPLACLPRTLSMKIDRKKLRELGSSFSIQDLRHLLLSSEPKVQPCTAAEEILHSLITSLLHLDPETVGMDDTFMMLGGDSISAMQLSALCREQGFSLSVQNILGPDTIRQLSTLLRSSVAFSYKDDQPQPFSLLDLDIPLEEFLMNLQTTWGFPASLVEDIYPCTLLQEGMMALSKKIPQAYVYCLSFKLASTTDLQRFQEAWQQVYSNNLILRTRIVHSQYGSLQVVLKGNMTWETELLDKNTIDFENFTYGNVLTKFAISKDGTFTWALHHSLYDGWSLPLLLKQVQMIYDGNKILKAPQFPVFVRYLQTEASQTSATYWESQLARVTTQTDFPPRSWSSKKSVGTDSFTTIKEELHLPAQKSFTAATLLKAAWALTMAIYSNSEESIFGLTLSGRNAPLARIECIVGPTFTTVPIRMKLEMTKSVSELLAHVQQQALDMIPHEHYGLQTIQKLGHGSAIACRFQTLLLVQAVANTDDPLTIMEQLPAKDEHTDNIGYPVVIDCTPQGSLVHVECQYDTARVSPDQMGRVLHQFGHVLEQLANSLDLPLNKLNLLSPQDHAQIMTWNPKLSEPVDETYTTLLRRQVTKSSHETALDAWDQILRYDELDRLASKLAHRLGYMGVPMGPDVLVPLIFRKTYCFTVAVLAVVKAGAAFVPLDPSIPRERLREILSQTKAKLVLVSEGDSNRIDDLGCLVTEVSRGLLDSLPDLDESAVIDGRTSSTNLLYAIFTSGSTGKPKGVLTNDRAFNTCALEKAPRIHRDASTRVLQFASHSFDTTVEDILTTLLCGGCICVPSDKDRLNNLAGFITDKAVNTADLTPTTMTVLDPKSIPTIRTLMLGGEPLTSASILTWSHIDLINVYGPSEASIVCIVKENVGLDADPAEIGHGVACRTWLVHPTNHDRLVPIGALGELLLEGHILAEGYLDNPEATAKAFIQSPQWAPSRKFYKTGDLVYYSSSGTIIFHGRKDTQIKLRGQRIELGEVENRLSAVLLDTEIAVDIILPAHGSVKDAGEDEILTAFISLDQERVCSRNTRPEVCQLTLSHDLSRRIHEAVQKLKDVLPPYMIPRLFVPMNFFPQTVSSKLDRKALREACAELSSQQLYALIGRSPSHVSKPETANELFLQQVWSEVLQLPVAQIGAMDDFFECGGNSISSIRLVSKVQQAAGSMLTVADIFAYPTLRGMANVFEARDIEDPTGHDVSAFSLISESQKSQILAQAHHVWNMTKTVIQDAYPCSPLQEGLIALTAQYPNAYVTQFTYALPADVDIERFMAAWTATVAANPILRTRIIYVEQIGTVQIILNEQPLWIDGEAMQEYQSSEPKIQMSYGDRLMNCALVPSSVSNTGGEQQTQFLLRMHHSIYDGWSLEQLLSELKTRYLGQSTPARPPYSNFIAYLQRDSVDSTQDFWKKRLSVEVSGNFPPVNGAASIQPDATAELNVALQSSPHNRISKPTLIQGAWAIVMARYLQVGDVVFGTIMAGRDVPLIGVSDIIGPVAATVPFRVSINWNHTIKEYLTILREQTVDMIAHQHAGLQNIRRFASDLDRACDFNNLLIVQPDDEEAGQWMLPVRQGLAKEYYTYPLVLECTLHSEGVRVEAIYNSGILSHDQIQILLSQLSHTMAQLDREADDLLSTLETISPLECSIIKSLNATVPFRFDRCAHDFIHDATIKAPDSPAIAGWDRSFTYQELEEASNLVASDLQYIGVGPEDFVPVLFEKSAWAIVSIVGVVKAGAAYVPLDPEHPPERILRIVEQVRAKAMLVSKKTKVMWESAHTTRSVRLLEISDDILQARTRYKELRPNLEVRPQNALYVVFTSGSTGKPKGVINDHQAYCSSAIPRARLMQRDSRSRVLQFASYSFDMSVDDILMTLMVGGCICVVSDDDRIGDISIPIRRMNINCAHLTPSYVDTQTPESLHGLEVLCVLGEAMTTSNIKSFAQKLTLINTYGPSEAAVVTTVTPRVTSTTDPANIGSAIGSRVWIVDASDHNRLSPIGAPGELLIEGPILARGYLHDEIKTNAAFITDPSWIQYFPDNLSTSEPRRFYKTGDVVQYCHDGTIKFLGRKDSQVKVR
jgi:amino acid adenylation domain-containing protein